MRFVILSGLLTFLLLLGEPDLARGWAAELPLGQHGSGERPAIPDPSDIASIHIKGDEISTPQLPDVKITLVSGTSYTDTSLTSGTMYYYVVTAVGPGNVESVSSNEAFATAP